MLMIEFFFTASRDFVDWTVAHGLKILVILVAAHLVKIFSNVFIEKIIRKTIVSNHTLSPEAEKKREDTLINIFQTTLRILLWILVVLTILSEIGIDIGPMLAAAGVAGLAFGFGGQYLIRDVISGLFIILENQYRVGDVACVNNTCGLVENITLRMTTLRDLDGTVHHIPNGEIKQASNLSKQFSRVNLDIRVAYHSDIEKVEQIINQVGQELADDPQWKNDIVTTPKFVRIEKFGDSAIIVKILGDTKPLRQWDVAGELRKRIKIAFDREGIEIPFPQRVIHQAK
jgi:small-conductance mechanosensitive channel